MNNFCIISPTPLLTCNGIYEFDDAPDDTAYNGRCKPGDPDWIPETCSDDPRIDVEWKQALSCGWWNGYDPCFIVNKALADITKLTQDLGVVTCVTTTLFYKTGVSNCNNIRQTWAVIYYSGLATDYDIYGQRTLAEKALQNIIPTFDGPEACPTLF